MELLALWQGSVDLEKALHSIFSPDFGEVCGKDRLDEILNFVDRVCEPLELPLKTFNFPEQPGKQVLLRFFESAFHLWKGIF